MTKPQCPCDISYRSVNETGLRYLSESNESQINCPSELTSVFTCDRLVFKGKAQEEAQAYRGKFLNEVMSHMHQILIFLHLLLETPTLLLFQKVKIIGCIEQGLYEAFPGAERRNLRGHCRAYPGPDHQDKLGGSLRLQAGQQFPLGQVEIE